MTLYGTPINATVHGGQISPSFGVSNAGTPPPATNNAIAVPAGMSILEAAARGILPRNANISSVNGVSTGAQNPAPVDDALSNGCGNQVNAGVAIAGTNGNPANNANSNAQQVFVDGVFTANAGLSTGPTPSNTETLTSCPVSGATYVTTLAGAANVALAGSFQG